MEKEHRRLKMTRNITDYPRFNRDGKSDRAYYCRESNWIE